MRPVKTQSFLVIGRQLHTQSPTAYRRAVVLSNGAAGAEKQAISLAMRLKDRMELPFTVVEAKLSSGLRNLPPAMHIALLRAMPLSWNSGYQRSVWDSIMLEGTFPDLIIGSGRTTVPLSIAVKRRSQNRAVNIQIQHPRTHHREFDMIVTPRHDFKSGFEPNLDSPFILTSGSVHGVTPHFLSTHRKLWSSAFSSMHAPLICVLIGGPAKGVSLSAQEMRDAVELAIGTIKKSNGGLLVSTSRRTPHEVVRVIHELLKESLSQNNYFFFDPSHKSENALEQAHENPLPGFLACADAFIVTADSVSMISEAMATGKPVFIAAANSASGKLHRFHQHIFARHLAKPLNDQLSASINENSDLAEVSNDEIDHIVDIISTRLAKKWSICT